MIVTNIFDILNSDLAVRLYICEADTSNDNESFQAQCAFNYLISLFDASAFHANASARVIVLNSTLDDLIQICLFLFFDLFLDIDVTMAAATDVFSK